MDSATCPTVLGALRSNLARQNDRDLGPSTDSIVLQKTDPTFSDGQKPLFLTLLFHMFFFSMFFRIYFPMVFYVFLIVSFF